MPKNVENFEIRTLGRDDYAQAAEIFAFVHALHQANRPDIYRKTNVPLGEDEFFKMCDDPHEIMLCAVRDGKILGLARTVMRGNAGDAVTLSRVRAVMEELAVLPQRHRAWASARHCCMRARRKRSAAVRNLWS